MTTMATIAVLLLPLPPDCDIAFLLVARKRRTYNAQPKSVQLDRLGYIGAAMNASAQIEGSASFTRG
jgi:hypothetical protein